MGLNSLTIAFQHFSYLLIFIPGMAQAPDWIPGLSTDTPVSIMFWSESMA
jgi:hypothetical protein